MHITQGINLKEKALVCVCVIETWSLFGPYTFKIIVFGPYFWMTLKITNDVPHVFILFVKQKTRVG